MSITLPDRITDLGSFCKKFSIDICGPGKKNTVKSVFVVSCIRDDVLRFMIITRAVTECYLIPPHTL